MRTSLWTIRVRMGLARCIATKDRVRDRRTLVITLNLRDFQRIVGPKMWDQPSARTTFKLSLKPTEAGPDKVREAADMSL